ncbi:hypothetical protein WMY93_033592 [Mugilogobius chulae]|uniref:MARVEL domain-containing protein n=1 Tax=Mugilogobius chulae TaxID=88201 RepID=A0AAW0MGV3_9GOBI
MAAQLQLPWKHSLWALEELSVVLFICAAIGPRGSERAGLVFDEQEPNLGVGGVSWDERKLEDFQDQLYQLLDLPCLSDLDSTGILDQYFSDVTDLIQRQGDCGWTNLGLGLVPSGLKQILRGVVCAEGRGLAERGGAMEGYGLKAGGAFDLMTFLKQPITVLRLLSWIFSIVVLACISNEGFVNRPDSPLDVCVFNGNAGACGMGQWAGSLALICSSAFIALDLYFPHLGSVRDRKRAVLWDILLSGLWSVVWFITFCFLANQWQTSSLENNLLSEGSDAARAAILFSFFSVFSWGGLTLLALERMKRVSFEEEYNKLFTPQT